MADVNGTNSNDILFFQGSVQQLTLTVVDPYTGDTYFFDEEKNVNTVSYDGLNGTDTIFMTNIGDAIFLENHITAARMVTSVERFFAGDGGDIISLGSTTYTLGNLLVDGGGAGDLIIANVGNDILNGREGDDIMSGGPGQDTLNGGNGMGTNSGNDTLNGGSDADILNGEDGDDTLVFFADGTFVNTFAYNAGSPGVPGTATMINVSNTNLSLDIFNGGAGFDTIQMTGGDDTLFLDDPYHTHHPSAGSLQIIGIEQINAGAGDDVVDLTHDTLAYGDIIINGGDGNDHLWSSAGNDVINGDAGDDHLFGGDGDDELNGGNDNDEIYGSLGNDILRGGAGNDVLFGGADRDSGYVVITGQQHVFNSTVVFPNLQERVDILDLVPPGDSALGIAAGDLSVDYETTAQITFLSTGAGYNNSLGFYNIALDGTIQSVELAFPNVKAVAAGSAATIELPGAPDTDFGFFIIANGANKNNDFCAYDLENGEFKFIYHKGKNDERLANIADSEDDISLVFYDGATIKTVVGSNNHIYHTTLRDGPTNLNSDGETHVVSGILDGSDGTTLRIGFEDLPNLGDADYNDVVFDLTVTGTQVETVLVDDGDTLIGGAGNDVMDGGIGNDILFGGDGADTIYGNQGADIFLFQALADAGDTLMDFSVGEDDVINITDVLQGYDSLQDDIDAFVQLASNGGDTELRVNADGQGNDFVTLATIAGGLGGVDLSGLIAGGNLVTDQSLFVV